jgi:hypothetical protein
LERGVEADEVFGGGEQATADGRGVELDDDEDAAGPEDVVGVVQGAASVGDVVECVDDQDGVDARVLELEDGAVGTNPLEFDDRPGSRSGVGCGETHLGTTLDVVRDIMASGALVASTLVMVALLVAVFVLVGRMQAVRAYSHTLGAKARGVASGASGTTQRSGVRVDPQVTLAVLVAAGFVVAAAVVGPDPMVFVAAVGALVLGYFAWGVYYLGRSHGLGNAHAVGLSAFFVSWVAVLVIAVKLLVG